jgi:DNA polymerase sigma
MIETDAFFENNLSVIAKEYISQQQNTASVGQLLYEFFVFFLYEFDPNNQVISVKEPSGFARKC